MLTIRARTASKRVRSVIRIGAFICVSLVAVGLGPRLAGLSPSGNAYALPGTFTGGTAECGSQYEPFTPSQNLTPCKRMAATCGPFGRSCWVCDAVVPERPMKEAPNSPTAKYYKKNVTPCPGTYTGECVNVSKTVFVSNFECKHKDVPDPQKSTCKDYEVTRDAAKCTYTPGGG